MVRVCVSAVLVVRPRLLVLSVASGGSLESYGAVPEAILGRIAVAVSAVKGAVMCISRVVPIFSLEDCEGVKLLMEYEDNAQRYVCVCVCVCERERGTESCTAAAAGALQTSSRPISWSTHKAMSSCATSESACRYMYAQHL